jgi:VCBS repeat-containing protein
MTKLRRRTVLAVGLAAAGALFVIPAMGQAGQEVVRLHLGSNGQYFRHLTTTQNLTTARNGCQITSAENLIDLSSSNGGTSQPGLASLAIGVKSSGSNANGSPCGQVDSVEKLYLQPTGSLAGRLFTKVRLDLEMTGNAVVKLTLSGPGGLQLYQLQTGTSIVAAQMAEPGYDTTAPYEVSSGPGDEVDACAAPNSSGPNSNVNDNCLWTVEPGFEFNQIEITATVGTVSLEGSGDFGNDPAYDSLLYLGNQAPVAAGDSYSTNEDTTLTVVAPGVLGNDSDADGDSLTAVLASSPSHGTLTLNADGSFTYTPASNYNGPDSFAYGASDGSSTSVAATVSITVNPLNDAPAVTNPDSQSGAEGDTVSLQVFATDVDGDQLTYSASGLPAGLSINPTTGLISGTIGQDASTGSPYSVTVTVDDGASPQQVSFAWTVADTMCSDDTVFDTEGDVSGYFTRLTDLEDCKEYAVEASAETGIVTFQPQGEVTVVYRAFIELGGDTPPSVGSPDGFTLFLEYDPTGTNTSYKPVPWCQDMVFGATVSATDIPLIGWLGSSVYAITSATVPGSPNETWCIAAAYTRDVGGELVTTWQLYGEDDPNFK